MRKGQSEREKNTYKYMARSRGGWVERGGEIRLPE